MTDIVKKHVMNVPPPGATGWLAQPELPRPEEILARLEDQEPLPVNVVDRPWPSKDAYLKAQYSILRQEGTEGLRYSVESYKSNSAMKDDKNTCIYTNVHVKGYLFTRMGPFCRISFSTCRAGRKIKWLQSKRLTPNSVVAISTARDQFQSICKIATVAQRPFSGYLDQNPPQIDIMWAEGNDIAVLDPNEELVMVESRNAYFEAVRHALVGLQHSSAYFSPLDKYYVGGSIRDASPAYIRASPLIDVSSLANNIQRESRTENLAARLVEAREPLRKHNILKGPPEIPAACTTLDKSQIEGVHRIISKEVAIVQGPPGTGKTFTSVSALKLLLQNRAKDDPPIIVSAQTNHALDQILTHCYNAHANILRVGGRTEDELIAKRTCYNLRRGANTGGHGQYRKLDKGRLSIINDINILVRDSVAYEFMNVDALLKAEYITESQHQSLIDHHTNNPEEFELLGPFPEWLGTQKVPYQTPLDMKQAQEEEEDDDEDDDDQENKEYEFDANLDYAQDDDSEKDRITGSWLGIETKWTGKASPGDFRWSQKAEECLAEYTSMWDIPVPRRGVVYRFLQLKMLHSTIRQFHDLLNKYTASCQALKTHKWTQDVQVMKTYEINVVGCTTTGLTKYRGFLMALEPRTLLIEEAAETREANITSAIFPSIQQLILVGDHQQLTPNCDVRRLGVAPYWLNKSLFERLVGLGLPYTMLNTQRRMVPEIRVLLSSFYDGLRDHPSVLKRGKVPGMGQNLWWFDHQWPEAVDVDNSRYNRQEAAMIIKFVAYLIQNGVDPSTITLLSYYNGQRKVLQKMLRKDAIAGDCCPKVTTVDSYQGEENDIIILSLVRSPIRPSHYSIGFLESKNRATVAISRARLGFYIFGNVTNVMRAPKSLTADTSVWPKVFNSFGEQHGLQRRVGLPIRCQNHGNEVWLQDADSFIGNAGGCRLKCQGKLPCGHNCELTCHPTSHDRLACLRPCPRTLCCGHKCHNNCTDKCFCDCNDFLQSMLGTTTLQPPNNSRMIGSSQSGEKPVSKGSNVADWQSFARNPGQHDENMRLARIEAIEKFMGARKAANDNSTSANSMHGGVAIQDNWKPVAVIDGRRANVGAVDCMTIHETDPAQTPKGKGKEKALDIFTSPLKAPKKEKKPEPSLVKYGYTYEEFDIRKLSMQPVDTASSSEIPVKASEALAQSVPAEEDLLMFD